MQIRDAVLSDFDEITAIYNEVLATSTAIYRDDPATREDRIAWWNSRKEQGYPLLVADTVFIAAQLLLQISGLGRAIVSPWKGRCTSIPLFAVRALEPSS